MRQVPLAPPPSGDLPSQVAWCMQQIASVARASQISTPESVAASVAAGYQPLNALLTAIAAVAPSSANKYLLSTGANAISLASITSVAQTLVAQATQSLMCTTGLGFSANGQSLVTAANYAAMVNLLGLVIGTNVEAWSAILDAIAQSGPAANELMYFTGGSTVALLAFPAFMQTFVQSASAAAARTTLVTETLGQVAGINTQTASYTLVLADEGKVIEMNVAGANTLTVPPNASVAFPVNTWINFSQVGAGQTTLTPGAGVTLNARIGLKTAGQWALGTMYQRATNVWVCGGDLSA